jgi:hypothetical protein
MREKVGIGWRRTLTQANAVRLSCPLLCFAVAHRLCSCIAITGLWQFLGKTVDTKTIAERLKHADKSLAKQGLRAGYRWATVAAESC